MIVWIILGGVAVFLLWSLLNISGEISQQERDEYRRQHGRWPEW